ncbi:MAG: YbhB/YbcL family Raf kinase inhibitor-like protein [Bacteroidales bacterium]|nr:YbhB/YbcL family Raf kinase inhibitor-like protein [Bacteroidales bacterium]
MTLKINLKLIILFFSFLNVFCAGSEKLNNKTNDSLVMKIVLKSNGFNDGEMMPAKFTCDGENISPQLSWDSVPEKTKTFAIICDDPDAPMRAWVHWVIFNIPANMKELKEGMKKNSILENGIKQGTTDFGETGYGGPCPPSDTHRYYFKIYALDCELNLKVDATKEQLLKAMEGHILAEGELIGKYRRK